MRLIPAIKGGRRVAIPLTQIVELAEEPRKNSWRDAVLTDGTTCDVSISDSDFQLLRYPETILPASGREQVALLERDTGNCTLHPVVGWRVPDDDAGDPEPIAPISLTDDNCTYAVVYPGGRVVNYDGEWSSIAKFVASQRADFPEPGSHLKTVS